MDLLLCYRRTVNHFPDAPAIIDGNVRMNWREYDLETRNLAAGLVALGAKPGDRIAILALNGYRYAAFYHGVIRMGGVMVPLNTRSAPAEHVYTLNDSGAVILVVDDTFLSMAETIAPHLPTVQHYLYAGNNPCPATMQAYQEVLETGRNLGTYQDHQPDENDLIGLFYTGGTTGYAKGVMLTHNSMMTNLLQSIATSLFPAPLNHLHVAPMFHLADGTFVFLTTALGGCHTFLPTFDPVTLLETIQRERITHTLLVPTMINILVQVPNIQDYDLSSLQRVSYGASPIPGEVLKKAMHVFPCQFVQGYGLTGASPALTLLSWEAHLKALHAEPGSPEARRLFSAGQPLVGIDVRIVDEQGQDVPVGEIGEIVARGPNVMKGYWKQSEETAITLRGDWLHTGDLASRDDQFFFFVVDRKKDMIISGGENIYSTEVENALYTHPAILEAAVFGVPDPKWGERVHAVVVLKPGQHTTPEELIASCRGKIAGYKVPRSIELADALPKSGAGKILKRILREKYWQDQPRQIH
jgi:long-chain acyl-CoA synthetase